MLDFWWLALMFFLAGIGIAPALSAMSSIVAATVKFSDTPEAYGWIGSGQLIGAAVGSAVAGILIDWQGPIGGFAVAFVLASAAAIVAWALRSRQPDLTQGIGEPPETAPVELPR
jgi:MFS family permease